MKIKIIAAISGVIAVILIAMTLINVFSVETGEVAIISRFGKINRVATDGLHFKVPFIESKSFIETRETTYVFGKTEKENNTLEVSTKDMQTILIELSVQAKITDPERLYRAFKTDYKERFIKPRVKGVVQAVIAKYTIEEFVSRREYISKIISQDVAENLSEFGISVSDVSIFNHDFSDEYEKAIEQKKIAEQAVERAKSEQQKILVEFENKVKIAELELKEKEIKAKANRIESESLTPQLLKKQMVEKWNGQLPKVIGANSTLLERLN